MLLLVVFRSIVILLKAIALNLLSVGAAYGVLVYVFQHGHFEDLLGFESIGGITAWLPLFLFVLLFGLSMDYHVFILSRLREGVDKGMSTDEAVAHGIKSTAGTVTSAAVVMALPGEVGVAAGGLARWCHDQAGGGDGDAGSRAGTRGKEAGLAGGCRGRPVSSPQFQSPSSFIDAGSRDSPDHGRVEQHAYRQPDAHHLEVERAEGGEDREHDDPGERKHVH